MPNTDIDPYSNPLCSGIENNLRNYCGDDIYTCMDLMCEYIATNVIEMYESTTVQRICRDQFCLGDAVINCIRCVVSDKGTALSELKL